MNPRKLIVFKHENHLGRARSGELFERVIITKNAGLPREWKDYKVEIKKEPKINGIEIIEKL